MQLLSYLVKEQNFSEASAYTNHQHHRHHRRWSSTHRRHRWVRFRKNPQILWLWLIFYFNLKRIQHIFVTIDAMDVIGWLLWSSTNYFYLFSSQFSHLFLNNSIDLCILLSFLLLLSCSKLSQKFYQHYCYLMESN